jgi:2-methylfumaryl-CoA isomerase
VSAALQTAAEPWFADRRVADIEHALGRTSVLWSRYRSFTDLASDGTLGKNPLLQQISQSGVGAVFA